MNASCRTARACSLSPPPKSNGDPISRSGFEFSTNVLHLVQQSAFLKSHIVKCSVSSPPRRQPSVSGFPEKTCTHPKVPFWCRVTSHCCCYWRPLLQALLDVPCTSFVLPVRLMRLSCRSPVPNFALQAYYHLPGIHPTPSLLMLVAQEL